MADRKDIEATYNYMDEFWRLSMGDHADVTCAMYEGDTSKTLEQAQADKHDYILKHLRFAPGARILDIGCGWGGFLLGLKERGGHGLGITLSTRQAAICQGANLDVQILDWNDADAATLGTFDGIVSIGSFEHFCSDTDYMEGRQGDIYRRFFGFCHGLLRDGGRMYLQTMTFGDRLPDPQQLSLKAPKGSDDYILAVLRKFYPGSWLPAGGSQIAESAAPYFSVVSTNNGRLDYIQTMTEWRDRTRSFSWRKVLAGIKTARYFFTDKDFRFRVETILNDYNLECFVRRIMDHERIVLERRRVRQPGGAAALPKNTGIPNIPPRA